MHRNAIYDFKNMLLLKLGIMIMLVFSVVVAHAGPTSNITLTKDTFTLVEGKSETFTLSIANSTYYFGADMGMSASLPWLIVPYVDPGRLIQFCYQVAPNNTCAGTYTVTTDGLTPSATPYNANAVIYNYRECTACAFGNCSGCTNYPNINKQISLTVLPAVSVSPKPINADFYSGCSANKKTVPVVVSNVGIESFGVSVAVTDAVNKPWFGIAADSTDSRVINVGASSVFNVEFDVTKLPAGIQTDSTNLRVYYNNGSKSTLVPSNITLMQQLPIVSYVAGAFEGCGKYNASVTVTPNTECTTIYKVYFGTDPNNLVENVSLGGSFTGVAPYTITPQFTGLQANSDYYYRVDAVNSFGTTTGATQKIAKENFPSQCISSMKTTGETPANMCVQSAVNGMSGNYFDKFTLNTVPALVLYYNSKLNDSGVFGANWTHLYADAISVVDSSTLRYLKADGGYLYYYLEGDGFYRAAQKLSDYSTIKTITGGYEWKDKFGNTRTFNSSGKITSIKTLNGNTTTVVYSGSNISSVTDSNGRALTFTISGGLVTDISSPAGGYTFSYSGGQLVTIKNAANVTVKSFVYTNGVMTAKTDANGNTSSHTLDADGNPYVFTDPLGTQTQTITYSQGTQSATKTDEIGGTWTYYYDYTLSKPTSIIAPNNGITTYSYDGSGNMTSYTDAKGAATYYTYDTKGNMLTVTDALGNVSTMAYNSNSQVTSVTNSAGSTTTYIYDAKGNLTGVAYPNSTTMAYVYDTKNNVTSWTNTDSTITTYVYDANNNLTRVNLPTGGAILYGYNAAGKVTSSSGAVSDTYTYDVLYRLIKITHTSDGTYKAYTYDAMGNMTSERDEQGNITYYQYDAKNRLIKITDPLGGMTTFVYGGCAGCGADKLSSVTDAKGKTTTYGYDVMGNRITETDPLGNTTTYTYDAVGNMISRTNATATVITYEYDAISRLKKKIYPDATNDTFAYDSVGRLTSAVNSNIGYTLSYNNVGSLLSVTDSNNRIVSYTYDSKGRKNKVTNPLNEAINYTYAGSGMLSSIASGAGTFSFLYDGYGRRTRLAYPGAFSTSQVNTSYDGRGRISSHEILQNPATYIYNNDSNISAIDNWLTLGGGQYRANYAYDSAGRVISGNIWRYQSPQYTEAISYDKLGNITLFNDNGNETTRSYNSVNQLTGDSGAGVTYTYDANGNLIQKSKTGDISVYTYNYENMLTRVVRTVSGATTKTIDFKYDPFGRRIKKTVTVGATVTTKNYVYDGEDILIEYNGSWVAGNKYTHGPGIDEPLAAKNSTATYYYFSDIRGNIMQIRGDNETFNYFAYNAYGQMVAVGARTTGQTSVPGDLTHPYRYTGREWDNETGLYYYRARYYDPSVGRFLSKDPIGFEGGWNLYAYVNGNPVNYTDPWGLIELVAGQKIPNEKIDKINEVTNKITDVINLVAGCSVNLPEFKYNFNVKTIAPSIPGELYIFPIKKPSLKLAPSFPNDSKGNKPVILMYYYLPF